MEKNVLRQSGVRFPEKLRYEDNYWSPLICCYINKVSFIFEVGYFYRKVSTSTVNQRNAMHHYDRLKIERLLHSEVKKRGLFNKYYDGWESIYIYRKTFNSIAMFTRKFEQPDYEIVRLLIKELKEDFPLWYKNKLWRKTKSKTAYLRSRFIAEYTELFIGMVKIKSTIKNWFR